jgi:glyoxalase-like protein
MALELDHLFIFATVGAREVEQLLEFGLTEGESNTHPGQGTACRRFFFHNAYLEFLWVHDEQEVTNAWVRPLGFDQRCRYQITGASPFGLVFRPSSIGGEPEELPFRTWALHAPYLPEPLKFDVAENSIETTEPLLFYMSFGRRSDNYPAERRQPLDHAAGFKEITGVRITLPGPPSPSEALQATERIGLVSFGSGSSHLAEVTFDTHKHEKLKDFRPELPLLFRW